MSYPSAGRVIYSATFGAIGGLVTWHAMVFNDPLVAFIVLTVLAFPGTPVLLLFMVFFWVPASILLGFDAATVVVPITFGFLFAGSAWLQIGLARMIRRRFWSPDKQISHRV